MGQNSMKKLTNYEVLVPVYNFTGIIIKKCRKKLEKNKRSNQSTVHISNRDQSHSGTLDLDASLPWPSWGLSGNHSDVGRVCQVTAVMRPAYDRMPQWIGGRTPLLGSEQPSPGFLKWQTVISHDALMSASSPRSLINRQSLGAGRNPCMQQVKCWHGISHVHFKSFKSFERLPGVLYLNDVVA